MSNIVWEFILSWFLTPWQDLENESFRILSEKRVFLPFQQDFLQDFRFFSLKIQVLEFRQYWKLEKIWFYAKNGKKTQTFYSKP